MKLRRYPVLWELKAKIKESKMTYVKISKIANISVEALNNKINGYSLFNTKEIEILAEILEINQIEIVRIFLPKLMQNVV